MMRTTRAASLIALLWAAICAAHADPVKLRVGWSDVPSSIMPILDRTPDLATHLGKTYNLDPIHFAGTAPMITALATGDLDIGEMAFGSFGLAIQNAHLTDIRVIADEMEDGVPGYLSIPYVVLKDGPVKTAADMKTRVAATNVVGSGTDIGMRAALRKAGLEDKRDYSEIEVPYASMKDALKQGRADLIATVHSTVLDPELQAIARPLLYLRDGMGVTAILFRVARAPFIAANRAALVDLFEDEDRALRWYLDPANHAKAVQIAAAFNKNSPAVYDSWLFTKSDIYRDPDNLPPLKALQSNLETQKAAGFLNIDIDVAKFADTSIVAEAAKRVAAGGPR
ncbi:MAG TPA: ABC transporter substrate-binding protein [Stellaceae bacterium]|jgi:NitT/TauT family transport system substrate-binding protein|nr:ABC transporter substrate-binding protein [Stellaceae bacterium]